MDVRQVVGIAKHLVQVSIRGLWLPLHLLDGERQLGPEYLLFVLFSWAPSSLPLLFFLLLIRFETFLLLWIFLILIRSIGVVFRLVFVAVILLQVIGGLGRIWVLFFLLFDFLKEKKRFDFSFTRKYLLNY